LSALGGKLTFLAREVFSYIIKYLRREGGLKFLQTQSYAIGDFDTEIDQSSAN